MQIELVRNADGLAEYMMIELQGTLDSCGRSLENETLGHLTWRKDNSEALLLIGHHLLEGKIHELEKPFALIRPTPDEEVDADKRSMIIDAIISRKLVFRNRPKPLITQQHLAQN
ncbi:Replication factor C complex [Trichostrongylus colubriformis]|uniref:Replication factor C complex n=1 Tax=Trichostrongylus colubriformis TaxID=6319 RepID=A0AAN8J1E5_TRICO